MKVCDEENETIILICYIPLLPLPADHSPVKTTSMSDTSINEHLTVVIASTICLVVIVVALLVVICTRRHRSKSAAFLDRSSPRLVLEQMGNSPPKEGEEGSNFATYAELGTGESRESPTGKVVKGKLLSSNDSCEATKTVIQSGVDDKSSVARGGEDYEEMKPAANGNDKLGCSSQSSPLDDEEHYASVKGPHPLHQSALPAVFGLSQGVSMQARAETDCNEYQNEATLRVAVNTVKVAATSNGGGQDRVVYDEAALHGDSPQEEEYQDMTELGTDKAGVQRPVPPCKLPNKDNDSTSCTSLDQTSHRADLISSRQRESYENHSVHDDAAIRNDLQQEEYQDMAQLGTNKDGVLHSVPPCTMPQQDIDSTSCTGLIQKISHRADPPPSGQQKSYENHSMQGDSSVTYSNC